MARTAKHPGFPAISLRQPNADRVIRGEKRRDSRSRPTRFRGWILLHASQSIDRENGGSDASALERGKLLGLVRLEDCVPDGKEWAYVWANPRRFRKPIAFRGHYSIPFYVPAKFIAGTPAAKVTAGSLEASSSVSSRGASSPLSSRGAKRRGISS